MGCREVWKRDHPRQFREGEKKNPFIRIFFRERKKKRGGKREREKERTLSKNSLAFFSSPLPCFSSICAHRRKKEWLPDSLCRSFFFYFSLPSPCSVRGKTSFDESLCV